MNALMVTVIVDNVKLHMEVDTSASVSILSEKTYHSAWPDDCQPPLLPSNTKLRTYTGETQKVLGKLNVVVSYKEQHKNLNLLVVQGDGPSLLGRDWLIQPQLDWKELQHIQCIAHQTLQEVLECHDNLFKEGLDPCWEQQPRST